MEAATLTGLAAGIGWASKKVLKEDMTANPSTNVMKYVKFTAVMIIWRNKRFFQINRLPLFGCRFFAI